MMLDEPTASLRVADERRALDDVCKAGGFFSLSDSSDSLDALVGNFVTGDFGCPSLGRSTLAGSGFDVGCGKTRFCFSVMAAPPFFDFV